MRGSGVRIPLAAPLRSLEDPRSPTALLGFTRGLPLSAPSDRSGAGLIVARSGFVVRCEGWSAAPTLLRRSTFTLASPRPSRGGGLPRPGEKRDLARGRCRPRLTPAGAHASCSCRGCGIGGRRSGSVLGLRQRSQRSSRRPEPPPPERGGAGCRLRVEERGCGGRHLAAGGQVRPTLPCSRIPGGPADCRSSGRAGTCPSCRSSPDRRARGSCAPW